MGRSAPTKRKAAARAEVSVRGARLHMDQREGGGTPEKLLSWSGCGLLFWPQGPGSIRAGVVRMESQTSGYPVVCW